MRWCKRWYAWMRHQAQAQERNWMGWWACERRSPMKWNEIRSKFVRAINLNIGGLSSRTPATYSAEHIHTEMYCANKTSEAIASNLAHATKKSCSFFPLDVFVYGPCVKLRAINVLLVAHFSVTNANYMFMQSIFWEHTLNLAPKMVWTIATRVQFCLCLQHAIISWSTLYFSFVCTALVCAAIFRRWPSFFSGVLIGFRMDYLALEIWKN